MATAITLTTGQAYLVGLAAINTIGNTITLSNGGATGVVLTPVGTPTIASNFGTSPSVTAGSTDMVGEINVGTGGIAAAGIINFAVTHTKAPICLVEVNDSVGANLRIMGATTSTTQAQFTTTVAWASGAKIWYMCFEPK